MLQSITQLNLRVLGKRQLKDLELILGSAEEALQHTQKTFDLVFLDWLGFLSPVGMRELDLAYNRLNEKGMIAVTLSTHSFHETRYKRLTGQQVTQEEYLCSWAEKNKMNTYHFDYRGGNKRNLPYRLYIFKKS
jgi:hypothetical protein